jgi:hypothetical protein
MRHIPARFMILACASESAVSVKASRQVFIALRKARRCCCGARLRQHFVILRTNVKKRAQTFSCMEKHYSHAESAHGDTSHKREETCTKLLLHGQALFSCGKCTTRYTCSIHNLYEPHENMTSPCVVYDACSHVLRAYLIRVSASIWKCLTQSSSRCPSSGSSEPPIASRNPFHPPLLDS